MPSFPIGPILEYYGADAIDEDSYHRPIRCPFHGERSPSATVTSTDEEQYFKCHACDMKGNAAQLIMKKEGLGYWPAVERAEEITGTRNGTVRRASRQGPSVPGKAGNQFSYSAFKRTWVRGEPDPGTQDGEG